MAHEAIGFGDFSTSTKHMRQFPAIESRSWKQKRGISTPATAHAYRTNTRHNKYRATTKSSIPQTCSTVYEVSTSTSFPSTNIFNVLTGAGAASCAAPTCSCRSPARAKFWERRDRSIFVLLLPPTMEAFACDSARKPDKKTSPKTQIRWV